MRGKYANIEILIINFAAPGLFLQSLSVNYIKILKDSVLIKEQN